jgi:hypothetical protein
MRSTREHTARGSPSKSRVRRVGRRAPAPLLALDGLQSLYREDLAPYGLAPTTLTLAPLALASVAPDPSRRRERRCSARRPPLLPLSSRSETPAGACRARAVNPLALDAPPMGFLCPSTFAAGGSNLHRAYLTQLCCAFRFSQPLDALFRHLPFRPYFVPVTPLGFTAFRGFPPTGSSPRSHDRALPSCRFPRPSEDGARRGSKGFRIRWVRSPRARG